MPFNFILLASLIVLGCIFAIVGIVLFVKGTGKESPTKNKFFGVELESKNSSLVIFIVGATFIAVAATKMKGEPDVADNFKGKNAAINDSKATDLITRMNAIGTTGWIFLGYFDLEVGKYTDEDYFMTRKTIYSSQPNTIKVHKQDVIQITKPRRVIIVDFKTKGAENKFHPPLTNIKSDDYTEITLPTNTILKVEDISVAGHPNSPKAVWARVRIAE